jgi:hypothetical protein
MELTLSNVLVYLSGVGVVAVVSWLFEEWMWYQSLVGRTKQLVFFRCVSGCRFCGYGGEYLC